MAIRQIKKKQILPITLEQAWEYFSTPANLNEITPPDITFQILDSLPEKMYEGMLINYKIAPLLNIPLNWTTEITHISPNEYFIDEQRFGPYKLWHHEHHFAEVRGGVCMTDHLYYDIGMGILGDVAGLLFVHKKVKWIFDYRFQKLAQLFS